MDSENCKQISDLIEQLTTSGESKLSDIKMKAVKNICRKSDEYVKHTFHLVWSQLKAEHAEIRLSAFQIIDELFRRSHAFRTLLLENFQMYLELTLEINPDAPLPPPKRVAESLKNNAYQALKAWHGTYSSAYRKLQLAYTYLQNCHQVDFNRAEHMTALQRQKEEQERIRREAIQTKRINLITADVNDTSPDIHTVILQLRTCLQLLLPHDEQLDIFQGGPDPIASGSSLNRNTRAASEETEAAGQLSSPKGSDVLVGSENLCSTLNKQLTANTLSAIEPAGPSHMHKEDNSDFDLQQHGFFNRKTNINVSFDKYVNVFENEENTDVIHNLDELKVLLTVKYLPMISKWLSHLQKNGASQDMLKRVIDIKHAAQNSLKELDILHITRVRDDADSDNDDFIEVPDTEMDEVEFLKSSLGMTGKHGPKPSSTSSPRGKQRLKETAPVLDYDLDLEYWENPDELRVPEVPDSDSNKFWLPNDRTRVVPDSFQELYSSRKIPFTGTFEPVKWTCRSPLPSGRLCPRMDRAKCPFHGNIIARNDDGSPANPDDARRLSAKMAKQKQEHPDWKDAQFVAELEAQTGVKLSKQKKEPNVKLTNIKKPEKTPRQRLESKVLSKGAMRRVANALNSLDSKRLKDKFCHSFNATFSK